MSPELTIRDIIHVLYGRLYYATKSHPYHSGLACTTTTPVPLTLYMLAQSTVTTVYMRNPMGCSEIFEARYLTAGSVALRANPKQQNQ